MAIRIPIAVSARHAHLSRATIDELFGSGYQLRPRTWLSQTGQFAAEEVVSLVGPEGQLDHVRLMGPPRELDQIELSRTDEHSLGVQAPVRISGDLLSQLNLLSLAPARLVSQWSAQQVDVCCKTVSSAPADTFI